jgi:DNA mismatch repair protein MutL
VNLEREELTSRRIEILREDVSRKIAAGEVIDRPFSVIRELLDNSIDARAEAVDVYIEGGGIARIRVVDDGTGMSRDDLLLCTERHATSKIREEGDLYRVQTLGFRGEALSSVAACSRLEIISKVRRGEGAEEAPAYRLRADGGKRLGVEEWRGNPGTVVGVSELFYNLPVRRKFLKSTAGETGMCRQTFLEKALPHPALSFRFFVDGKIKSFLPPQGQKERICEAFALPVQHFSLLDAEQKSVHLRIVAARPELSRRDKRLIQIYVNRRRIYEYSLVHAVEYAYGSYMPGGRHPVAFVFLDLDPELVDFNVHPAKREARFRDLPSLHQLVSGTLKGYLSSFDLRIPRGGSTADVEGIFAFPKGGSAHGRPEPAGRKVAGIGPIDAHTRGDRGGREFHVDRIPAPPDARGAVELPAHGPGVSRSSGPEVSGPEDAEPRPVYRGQLFKLFLLVEYGTSLFIVDQHAAHERILFEQLASADPVSQELLMPIRLEIGESAAEVISGRGELFKRLGIRVERGDDDTYELSALPEALISIDEEELVQALLWEKGSVDELVDRVYSLASCRLAIKEGQEVDPLTATELVHKVFALSNARCPHGRPIWYEVQRKQLLREVKRL